jgi:DNA-binding response OmpR family regulator
MPSSINLLIIDDDEALSKLLASELSAAGYGVDTASDGEAGIRKVGEKNYDIVLLDIHLPKMDGFQVLGYIKDNLPRTKVIVLTAHTDVKNAIQSVKLGARDFLGKPFDMGELVTSIDRVLKR